MYSVTLFAKQMEVSVKTLQRWGREGRLKAKRILSEWRYYDDADLARALIKHLCETHYTKLVVMNTETLSLQNKSLSRM